MQLFFLVYFYDMSVNTYIYICIYISISGTVIRYMTMFRYMTMLLYKTMHVVAVFFVIHLTV